MWLFEVIIEENILKIEYRLKGFYNILGKIYEDILIRNILKNVWIIKIKKYFVRI